MMARTLIFKILLFKFEWHRYKGISILNIYSLIEWRINGEYNNRIIDRALFKIEKSDSRLEINIFYFRFAYERTVRTMIFKLQKDA